MSFRKLKAFLTVCECGNITRAAELLHITQPALTRQIQELEKEFGCILFNRTKRKIELTEQGFQLQLRAAEMLELEQRTKQELKVAGGELAGIVRIGCVESKAAGLVTDFLSEWLVQSKRLSFELYSADGNDIRTKIDENYLDFGFCLEPIEVAKYDVVPFETSDQWGVVVSRSTVYNKYAQIDREALMNIPLILPRRSLVLENLKSWFSLKQQNLRILGYHNLPTNALCMVKKGIGGLLCVEGSYAVRPDPELRFIALSPQRTVKHCLIRKKNRSLSKTSELFWKYAVDKIQESNKK